MGSQSNSVIKDWLPIVAITLSAFVLNTSEFIPIGLLTDIANDFAITESQAGMMIAIYAWVVTLASLPLMLAVSRMEFKRLLMYVLGFFVISQVATVCSPNFELLVASRIGVACSHAIFWSIAAPMAIKAAPEGRRAGAMAMLVSGTSLATVAGLPLGRVIGLYIGWRITFAVIGVLALVSLLFIKAVFPRIPSSGKMAIRQLPALFGKPELLGIYLMTAFMVTSFYSAYSYIEPFLGKVANLTPNHVTWVLAGYGLVGFVGSFVFSKFFDNHRAFLEKFGVIGILLSLFLLHVAAYNPYAVTAVCIFWGFAYMIYNLVFQTDIILVAPEASAIATSVYSGTYNLGIGMGALYGGIVIDHGDLSYIGYTGGALGIIAALICVFWLIPRLNLIKK